MAYILYFCPVALDRERMTGIVPIMKNNENNKLMTVTSTITNDKYRNKFLCLLDEPTNCKKPAFFKHYKTIASEMEFFVATSGLFKGLSCLLVSVSTTVFTNGTYVNQKYSMKRYGLFCLKITFPWYVLNTKSLGCDYSFCQKQYHSPQLLLTAVEGSIRTS